MQNINNKGQPGEQGEQGIQGTQGNPGPTGPSGLGSVVLTGTPSDGQVVTATSTTTAAWQTPTGGNGGGNTFVYRAGEPSPSGNVFATWNDAYAAATASGVPSVIVIDDHISECSMGLTGSAAAVTSFATPHATITGLTGMTPDMVGISLTFHGAASSGNNGTFVIATYISATSVQVTNASGVSGDVNNGEIYWFLLTDYDLSKITLSGIGVGCSVLFIYDGVTWNEGVEHLTEGVIVLTEYNVQNYLGTPTSEMSLRVDRFAEIGPDDNGGIFDLSVNSVFAVLYVDSFGYVGSEGVTGPFFNFGASDNCFLDVYFGESASFDSWLVVGSSTETEIQLNFMSPTLGYTPNPFPGLTNYAGDVQVNWLGQVSALIPFTGSGAFPTPTNGYPGNVTTGTMYYDQTSGKPWWWNGASWVAFGTAVFIYRVGSTPAGNVFSSFDTAYAAAQVAVAQGLPVVIGIDDYTIGGVCEITTVRDYDLSQITLSGGYGTNPNTLIVNGNITFDEGIYKVTNGLNVFTYQGPGQTLVTASGSTQLNTYVEKNSQIAAKAFGYIWGLVGDSYTLNLYVGDGCLVSGNADDAQVVDTGSAGTLNLYLQGSSSTAMYDVATGEGIVNFYVGAGGSYPTPSQMTFFSGTSAYYFEAQAANLVPYTGSGSFPTQSTNPNVTIGSMYFDQTSTAPYWWNGTAWVPAIGVSVSGSPSVNKVLTATSSSQADWQYPSGGSGSNIFTYREGGSPGGNVYASFDAAYQAASATGVPATIIFDDSDGDCFIAPLISGGNASFSDFDGSLLTVTGLTGMTPDMVGQYMTLWGTANSANNGSNFVISAYISDTSVQISNEFAVYPDDNSGNIDWALNIDYNLSQITLSGLTPGVYEGPTTLVGIVDGITFNEGLACVTGGVWLICNFNIQQFLGYLGGGYYFMRVDDYAVMAVDNYGCLWNVSSDGVPNVYMEISNGAAILSNGGCGPCFFTGSENSAGVSVTVGDLAYIDDGFVAGTSGTFVLRVVSPSAQLPTSFGFDGTTYVYFLTQAYNLQPYAGSGAFPSPISGQVSPNIVPGTMYYDQSGLQAYWWTGSGWVSWSNDQIAGVTLSGTPSTGQVLTATADNTATWQNPAAGTPNLFIYRSGATPSGNVYNSFDDAYNAAFAATSVGVTAIIGIDDTTSACTLDTGNGYDLTNITLMGGFGGGVNTLTINSGFFGFGMSRVINNLTVIYTTNGSAALCSVSSTTINTYIENNCSIQTTGNSGIWAVGSSATVNLYLGDGCTIPSANAFYIPNTEGILNVYLRGIGSEIADNSVLVAYGSAIINLYISSGAIYPNFVNNVVEGGVINFIFVENAQSLVPYTGSGTFPTPTDPNPSIQTGTMYFDQSSESPWWWNGTAWVQAYAPPPNPSIIFGLTNNQAANLSAGDHVTFTGPQFQQGSNISLDSTSPYTTALGQPSVGRITLGANKTYKLVGCVVQVQSTGGNFFTQWANATDGGILGAGTRTQTISGDNDVTGQAIAYITVGGSPILIELQITFNAGVTSIGEAGASLLFPWFTAEEVV